MSVSRRWGPRLLTEREMEEANARGWILVPDTPPAQQHYNDEVPVATDDEETLKGTPGRTGTSGQETGPQREQSDSLPPSSPISVAFTDEGQETAAHHQILDSPRSFDSAPLWDAVSPIPRTQAGPASVLFDDHEAMDYEEGEVTEYRHDTRGPPSNQEQSRMEYAERNMTPEERHEHVLGEHSVSRPSPDSALTASKRPWMGSPTSEELNWSSQRPKCDASDVHQNTIRLPPIHEMMNPWRGMDDLEPARRTCSRDTPMTGEERWPGGYVPQPRRGQRDDEDDGRRPAVEGLGRLGGEGARGGSNSFFSAIPNTKAWAYKTRTGGEAEDEPSRDDEEVMSVDKEASIQDKGRGVCEERHRTQECPEPSASGDGEEDVPRWYHDDETQGPFGRSTLYEDFGATPTAMAEDESAGDVPVLLVSPTDSKWATHFDNPETILGGQSAEWTRVIWRDGKPIILFTVYNYKYTKDATINRHIELGVTSLTTFLTGETTFYVVPPDPDWRYTIKTRDLPFVWVIRGLSEKGARTMTKLRVISTKTVSIMTYPWVCGLLESIPQHRRVEYVVSSLKIKVMSAEDEEFVANMYLFLPTDDMGRWREWAGEMRSSRYNVFLNSTGTARKFFWCANCRGVDHEADECPFPTMEGWKGPEAVGDMTMAEDKATEANGIWGHEAFGRDQLSRKMG
ncbi:hypothetical protein C8T65DRAFT_700208 [Cerioporus squamosus]|nr:hypothetical protein C8T65DRAFT_700208 [Cerioporus squamosus]